MDRWWFPIRSIRWRVVALFIVVGYIVGGAVRLSNYGFIRDRLEFEQENRLGRRLKVLEELTRTGAPDTITGPVMEALLVSPEGRVSLLPYHHRLWLPEDDQEKEGEFTGQWSGERWIRGWGLPGGLGDPATLDPQRYQIRQVPAPDGGLLVAGYDRTGINSELTRLVVVYLATMLFGTIVLLPLVWWISSLALAPVRAIGRTARRIASGESRLRLETATMASELREMGGALNGMIDRLEGQALAQAAFTADISHELGNPINTILLQAQLAGDPQVSADELRATLRSCGETAGRMNRLRESLLQLSRADATGPSDFAPIDLEPVLEEALGNIRDLAKARQVGLECQPSSLEARGDADLLHQVLVNLLTNAIRHSPAGGTVHLEAQSTQDGAVAVTVRDEGPGVAPELVPHLFGRFRSGGKKTGRKMDGHGQEAEGNGLGLAICQSILVAHRGSIRYRPGPKGGALFEIRLPGVETETG
jgi:signal transduction histidine kinase